MILSYMNLELICAPKSIYTLQYVADHPELTKSEIFGQKGELDRTIMKRLEELIEEGLIDAHPGGKVKGRDVLRHTVTRRGNLVLAQLMVLESL